MAFLRVTCSLALACGLATFSLVVAEGRPDGFLASASKPDNLVVSKQSIVAAVVTAMESETSRNITRAHLKALEGQLLPTFEALPQRSSGRVDSMGTRYLLYRHFAEQQGWLMHGLVPSQDSFLFPLHLLEGGPDVRDKVEQEFRDGGLSLHEVAVLAAMLESQVHADAAERARRVWQEHGLQPEATTSVAVLESVVDVHALTYLLPDLWYNLTSGRMGSAGVAAVLAEIPQLYPSWDRTRRLLRLAMEEVVGLVNEPGFSPGLQEAERSAQKVVESFGHWQDQECRLLRQKLVSLETRRVGRVELADFYSAGLGLGQGEGQGQWMFYETVPYLRTLGALDEADASRPAVIIPNYVSSGANHVGASRYFDLACVDHCMDLLGSIERDVRGPRATPWQIAAAVESKGAWGHISEQLLAELGEGQVALHSREFALWLHRAFPRDCQHPSEGQTSRYLMQDQYERRTKLPAWETSRGMAQVVRRLKEEASKPGGSAGTLLPDMHFLHLLVGVVAGLSMLWIIVDFATRMLLVLGSKKHREGQLFVL